MPFDEVLGQEYAVKVLKSALASAKLGSAYLFHGPEGCGKKTTALSLAQALLCADQPGLGCGKCGPCQRIAKGIHPDVLAFAPAGAFFKVDQAREILRQSSLKAYEGKARVFLLDGVEALNQEAGNALLKLLEEPPPGLVLVLVTSQPARLLPTLASRCQALRFSPLPESALVALLVQKRGCTEGEAREAAALAGGSLPRAAHLLKDEGRETLARAEGLLAALASDSRVEKLAWAASAGTGREELQDLMDLCGVLARELWARRQGLPAGLRLLKDEPPRGRALSPARLMEATQALRRAKDALRRNGSVPLAMELLALS